MRFDEFSFGSIHIDGSYEHDVIIDPGPPRDPSVRAVRGTFGTWPLADSMGDYPWDGWDSHA